MTDETFAMWLFLGGCAHFSILTASALVPFRLDWKRELGCLKPLHRQMYWTYGGYTVMAIVAFGVLSVTNAGELAAGSLLSRMLCGYVAIFWGVRLGLQPVFDVKEHLTAWWLRAGYHTLTVVFVGLTVLYGYAAVRA
ncbi:MAG: hypothetical protein AAGJ97_01400 [Planctomycetota bacterium]